MRKISFLLVFFFAFGPILCAQDKTSANTLLWRISGKGLTRPSYLFGTMHLTDKRVFQLGDSVYRAIEETEGFAAELDMNRVGTQMINYFILQEEQKNATQPARVKDKVSAETWDRYKDQLEKKFNKKADKISVDDLEEIESKLEADLFKKGDMPTFLDAWLSGQARKQGKWVGGIEDLEDQMEHIDDIESKIQMALFDDEYYRGGVEWLLKLYVGQRLDSIDAMMYREANGSKDYIMIKRNLKMSRRMDSLSAIRSTLFAVGAAHLPGDSGVISLLRNRGFTVTPVFSSKKISADKYISKSGSSAWFPVPVEDSSYNLLMPGIAESFEMFRSMGLDMKLFFDISFMKMYMTIGFELPEERKRLGYDSLYKALSERYNAKGSSMKEKKITVSGIEGREYRISIDEGEMRMQVFIPSLEYVIMNLVFGFNEKSINDGETVRFFQSFTYNGSRSKATKAEKVWTRLEYPGQSFSVEIPLKPRETKDAVSEEGKTTYNWQGIDMKEQVFYGMSVSAMQEGMYDPTGDSVYFESLKTHLRSSFEDASILDSAHVTVNGYPGFRLTVKGKTDKEEIVTKVLSVARGGLNYYIYSVYNPGPAGDMAANKFLGSFRLTPYKHPEWKTFTSPDRSFSTTGPFAIIRKEREEEEESNSGAERFIMYDSVASVTGYVDKTVIPDWFWYTTDTGFLRILSSNYIRNWEDSIIEYKVEKKGEEQIASFLVVKQGDDLVRKVKLVLNGDELYELFGFFSGKDLPGLYNKFYDDFRILNIKNTKARTDPRTAQLVQALKNPDKKTALQVKTWWDDIPFTAADVPYLQETMLRLYPDFDTSYYGNLNKKIFDVIEALDSTHTTVQYLRKNYPAIAGRNEYVKPFAIGYLSNVQTRESYAVLKECLLRYPIRGEETLPAFSNSLYDSLSLTAQLFPELMQLAENKPLWDLVTSITRALFDSNHVSKIVVKEYGKHFLAVARQLLDEEKEKVEESWYLYEDIIRILGVIGGPETQALLKKFSQFDNRHIKFHTLIAMLESNMTADSRTIYTMATTDEYRHDLYDELERLGKLKLFPGNYLTQKLLGQSKLYEYATDEEAPTSISHLDEKVVIYKGKEQKFYLYKVSFSEEESYDYLGIAGPYPADRRIMKSSHAATGVHWDEEFDKKEIDKLFKAYMAMLEELDEESD